MIPCGTKWWPLQNRSVPTKGFQIQYEEVFGPKTHKQKSTPNLRGNLENEGKIHCRPFPPNKVHQIIGRDSYGRGFTVIFFFVPGSSISKTDGFLCSRFLGRWQFLTHPRKLKFAVPHLRWPLNGQIRDELWHLKSQIRWLERFKVESIRSFLWYKPTNADEVRFTLMGNIAIKK